MLPLSSTEQRFCLNELNAMTLEISRVFFMVNSFENSLELGTGVHL